MVTIPLVLFVTPSVVIGAWVIQPMPFDRFFKHGAVFSEAIFNSENHEMTKVPAEGSRG